LITLRINCDVIAVDIDHAKLALATRIGADLVIDASTSDPAAEIQRTLRGAHGVLVTAVSRAAFSQALGMLHKRGTMSLVGLPPGEFALPIFDVVLNAKTVRGSIVGTRRTCRSCSISRATASFAASAARIGSTTSTRSSPA
jgi:propanol-preferring alcohol dehydrogenase